MFQHTSFRTKLFVGSFSAAAVSLLVVGALLSYQVRERQRDAIQQRLTDEARLIADLISSAALARCRTDGPRPAPVSIRSRS